MDEDEEEVFGMISVIDMDACSQVPYFYQYSSFHFLNISSF